MNNSIRTTVASVVLASAAYGGVCAANDCKPMDPESAVAKLVSQHAGGKVLKVEEKIDAKGCAELKVRILIDGTIKAITIANGTGA